MCILRRKVECKIDANNELGTAYDTADKLRRIWPGKNGRRVKCACKAPCTYRALPKRRTFRIVRNNGVRIEDCSNTTLGNHLHFVFALNRLFLELERIIKILI